MLIRLATLEDADAIAGVFSRARERMKYLAELHTAAETKDFIRNDVLGTREVWVTERDAQVLAFAALHGDLLELLYVHPLAQGFGLGSALLDRMKAQRPEGLTAWVFQKNTGARRFYEVRGFALVKLSDGSTNEEQEPDALYAWQPARK